MLSRLPVVVYQHLAAISHVHLRVNKRFVELLPDAVKHLYASHSVHPGKGTKTTFVL